VTRVLIVDDSPTVRLLLDRVLGADPAIEVVGCAADGAEALRMTLDQRPDVITMDLNMPGMDGVAATVEIMRQCATPIVIVSGCAVPGEVDASFRAIEAGALVAVQRPAPPGHPSHAADAAALVRTVKSMAEVRVVRRWAASRMAAGAAQRVRNGVARPQLVLVGASTGGPAVLREILCELRPGFPLPLVIVQHMAPGFGPGFAAWLAKASRFDVRVAQHNEQLVPGSAYLVPDGVQPRITRERRIELAPRGAEHGMCPSVSHLFRCVHPDLCAGTLAVLLTGMGKDGAAELRALKDKGAVTIVQDRASSAVYGMPGEAIRLDAAKFVLAPAEIGRILDGLGHGQGEGMPLLGNRSNE
jgi:two-component system, chemotaxis family, protein-glutamate methylesterase/glutaminase